MMDNPPLSPYCTDTIMKTVVWACSSFSTAYFMLKGRDMFLIDWQDEVLYWHLLFNIFKLLDFWHDYFICFNVGYNSNVTMTTFPKCFPFSTFERPFTVRNGIYCFLRCFITSLNKLNFTSLPMIVVYRTKKKTSFLKHWVGWKGNQMNQDSNGNRKDHSQSY